METPKLPRDVSFVSQERARAGLPPALAHLVAFTMLAVGFFPMAVWLAGLGLAIAEWRFEGLWPIHVQPYPYHRSSELPLGWLEWLAPILVFLLVATVVQLGLHRLLRRRWWTLVTPAIAVGFWIAGQAVLSCDPGSIMAWYFD